jgi:hypothetical protein
MVNVCSVQSCNEGGSKARQVRTPNSTASAQQSLQQHAGGVPCCLDPVRFYLGVVWVHSCCKPQPVLAPDLRSTQLRRSLGSTLTGAGNNARFDASLCSPF